MDLREVRLHHNPMECPLARQLVGVAWAIFLLVGFAVPSLSLGQEREYYTPSGPKHQIHLTPPQKQIRSQAGTRNSGFAYPSRQASYQQDVAAQIKQAEQLVQDLGQRQTQPALSSPRGLTTQPNVPEYRVNRNQQQYEVLPIPPANIDVTESNGKVSIIARAAYLRDVLSVLSEQYKVNFVHGPIDDQVTVSIRDVTLEDALTSLLSVAGCTWSNRNGIIHVTPLGSQQQQRGYVSPDTSGLQVKVFQLDFVAAEDVNQVITGMLSPVGFSYVLSTDSKNHLKTRETVVVEDVESSINRIQRYINQIDVAPRQVVIEARVLECRLRDNMKHGVNFEHIGNIAGSSIRVGTIGMTASGASTLFAEINGNELDGFIDALQTVVETKTLASPQILALNGQEAKMQVGQQLGFRVLTTTQTSTLEDVRFLDVGIVLTVTPTISRDGRILLKVKPEVSSGQINPDTGLPEEETSEVETNVMLTHGQGMVIGGLIQERENDTKSQVPKVGNIPVVGKLFQRKEAERQRTEIIFVLIPRIIEGHCDDISVPADVMGLNQRDRINVNRTRDNMLDSQLNRYPRPYQTQYEQHESERHYNGPAYQGQYQDFGQPYQQQMAPPEPQNYYPQDRGGASPQAHPEGCSCQACVKQRRLSWAAQQPNRQFQPAPQSRQQMAQGTVYQLGDSPRVTPAAQFPSNRVRQTQYQSGNQSYQQRVSPIRSQYRR